jgi:hypothetical protein
MNGTGQASVCYNPEVFKPNNQPLLSKGQWSMVQLFLVDAANLPLSTTGPNSFPDEKAVPIFRKIHDAAAFFKSNTLPKSNELGNSLYNYGTTAHATFRALINIMDQPKPDKDTLRNLFGNLSSMAAKSQTDAGDVFNGTKAFANELTTQKPLLETVVRDEITARGGLQSQITILNNDITAQQGTIQSAQAAIVQDRKVINDTVYYSWIPLVGTIVAVAIIIARNEDIKTQLNRINGAVAKIQEDNGKLQPLNARVAQLAYAQNFNNGLITKIGDVLPVIQTIQGAWGTINSLLGNVIGHINTAQDPKSIGCLAAIELTTAANIWKDVAGDAHAYMQNFYVTNEKNMPIAA